jgi:hypothetical protein
MDLALPSALSMDDAIRQAIADLSALIEGADREDAERIRELIERLQNFDAHVRCPQEGIFRLHIKFSR